MDSQLYSGRSGDASMVPVPNCQGGSGVAPDVQDGAGGAEVVDIIGVRLIV